MARLKAPEDTACLRRERVLGRKRVLRRAPVPGHPQVMAIAAAGNEATGQPQQPPGPHAATACVAGAQGFDGTKSSAQSGHGKLLEQTRYSLLRPEVIIPAGAAVCLSADLGPLSSPISLCGRMAATPHHSIFEAGDGIATAM